MQFADIYPDIKKAIGKISPKPVRYIINTRGHNGHTNGNASLCGRLSADHHCPSQYRRVDEGV
ncbi:hypothetical protein EGK75_12300 [Neisseria weixii]|uniref:Uncharacterized protein n=1 Tax=Neisseria weixii TaxID=1853276 RepID=A0A3N4MJ75_9NEIS|nr:hypothetical protein [Neisseria weixii]RPD83571.1 hypothetical protein EGK74_12135 [Neisseria weixii]RPD84208.1 hypothetical protein EGK75_12300 [Neisseria weixii]